MRSFIEEWLLENKVYTSEVDEFLQVSTLV